VSARRPTFPLVPRRRFAGLYGGTHRSVRRGDGDEVVGTRAYRPGDAIAAIDWAASARLSAARGTDEFVVHEFYAEETPRVAVVVDPSPTMALYAPPLPWLDKEAAAREAAELIARSARASRAVVVDPPARPEDALAQSLDRLARRPALLPLGSFVFVLSDFLRPLGARRWRALAARGWDVVPVVVQDPTWERSFPPVAGVALPFVEPGETVVREVWLSPRAVAHRRAEHESRFARLLAGFRALGLDPVVLDTADPDDAHARFVAWADRRRRLRRRTA
jgi:uncharacterized protein (DUF58 family)